MTGTTARWVTSRASTARATAAALNEGQSRTDDPVITARRTSESPPMCPSDRQRPQRSAAVSSRRPATAAAEAAKAARVNPTARGAPEEPEVRMKVVTSGKPAQRPDSAGARPSAGLPGCPGRAA